MQRCFDSSRPAIQQGVHAVKCAREFLPLVCSHDTGRMSAGVLGCMESLRGTMQAEQCAAATFLLIWFRHILSPLQASILMVQVRPPAALPMENEQCPAALEVENTQFPALTLAPLALVAAPRGVPFLRHSSFECGKFLTSQPSPWHTVPARYCRVNFKTLLIKFTTRIPRGPSEFLIYRGLKDELFNVSRQ